jgi:glucose/arabinose dehydrogenase
LAIGSDGFLYIAQLSGFPFAPGSADVFRYDFDNNQVTTFSSGFSNLVDIAAGPDNSLYLLQYRNDFWASPTGSILRLGLDGSVETLFSGLTNPTALAVAPDGTIYVTNNGNGVNGELLQLTPQPVSAPLPIFGLGLAWTQARRLRRRCGGVG